jgi:serine/threonine-protein kinase
MGEVFLAHDTELDRSVALKLMTKELAQDPEKRRRFRTEAKAASGLLHPNVCVIHEVGETDDGRPFLAMEYIDGQSLDAVMQQRRLRLRDIIDLGIEVAEALEAAHARGVVHRDIKPANIMLDRRSRAKVLDFGLAKRVAESGLHQTTTSLAHTQTGVMLGTPHYMSPEQVLGREVDARSDLFSLGVVLYEAVTRGRPFLGATIGEVINNVVNQQPEPLGLENPRYSPALDRIIFKCLEKEPARRYASARELIKDLAQLRTAVDRSLAEPAPAPAATIAGKPAGQPAPPKALAPPAARTRVWVASAVGAACLVGAGLLWWSLSAPSTPGGDPGKPATLAKVPSKSVAVLPFDNFSGEADTDYLSDGLTEEITSALSRVPGLKVAARNSAFTFKGRKADARQVGEALRVATLLEGSVRKAGKQLRITVQLINAADGFHLWSEVYDRSIDDIFSVQTEIAHRIAERLQGKTGQPLPKLKAADQEAHKAYLQALEFWNKRTEPGLRRAIELFQNAIEKDPTYAAAHAGLASTYVLIPIFGVPANPREYQTLARAAARRALELDPGCAQAHAVMGIVLEGDRDPKAAEDHYREAIKLDPNYATAHQWYGRFLNYQGRREEALASLQTALDLDPLSKIIHCTIPEYYSFNRDYDRAIIEGRNVIEKFPGFPPAHAILAEILMCKGLYAEALEEIDRVRSLQPQEPLAMLDARAYVLARTGREPEARAILVTLEQVYAQGKPIEKGLALVHVGLREFDKAMDLIEKVHEREGLEYQMLCHPTCDELRQHPRFQALLKRLGGPKSAAESKV